MDWFWDHVVSFFFMYRRLANEWDGIRSGFSLIQVSSIAGIFCLCVLSFVFLAAAFRASLVINAGVLPDKKVYRIYFITNVLRYIPGGIWNFTGRIGLLRELGMTSWQIAASALWELISLLSTGSVMALVGLALVMKTVWFWVLPVIPIAFVLLFFCLPSRYLPSWIRVYDRYRQVSNIGLIWKMFFFHLCSWLMYGFAFAWLLSELTELQLRDILFLIPLSVTAWFAGFLSPSPAGFGVRELAMSSMLNQTNGSFAILAVLVQRALEMLAEILLWLTGWIGKSE